LVSEVLTYWKSQPGRALRGWTWRVQRCLGVHTHMISRPAGREGDLVWGPRVHAVSFLVLSALMAYRLRRVWTIDPRRLFGAPSLGAIVTLLFILYSTIHAIFVYVSFRHVVPCVPTLVAAVTFVAFEAFPALGETTTPRPEPPRRQSRSAS
jgi:hypothetical protein